MIDDEISLLFHEILYRDMQKQNYGIVKKSL